ncbi:MAG: methionine gamma-lyase family protein [Clostridia bacterium]|nr:methionine gamma-lyase family protein [Clostridia bacterium]
MTFDLYHRFGVSRDVYELGLEADRHIAGRIREIKSVREANQLRVLSALQQVRLSDSHFIMGAGYGYDDPGRDRIDQAYALVFGAEAALVRAQISAGTQAIASCLYGNLRPGDVLLSVTGKPYDTLASTIGTDPDGSGSLAEFGVGFRRVDLAPDGKPDEQAIRSSLGPEVRMVYIQKSRGYTDRRSLMSGDIADIVRIVRSTGSKAVIMVDNCYGEFVETTEPTMAGADLCAGSLIKNPGGGLCPTGGYVAGRRDLVERAAARLTAPGLAGHVGPTLGLNRSIAQGFYMAPHIVAEALKGAVFAAEIFRLAGFSTAPASWDERGDIVQSITFGSRQPLLRFCRAIQAAAPVDSHVTPEPWDMPGYDCPVIMAAGTFVQGASIELSADGPVKPPYTAYMQGGMVYENVRLACLMALSAGGERS